MTNAALDLKLEVTRTLPFPPERMFDAWLDPKMLARFMVPARGVTVPEVSTDAVVGGRFHIVMQMEDGTQIPHHGVYKRIARASQLVFTWASPYSVDDSTVTLDLAPTDTGTKVTLTQVKFPTDSSRDNHEKGWSLILATLDGALAE